MMNPGRCPQQAPSFDSPAINGRTVSPMKVNTHFRNTQSNAYQVEKRRVLQNVGE